MKFNLVNVLKKLRFAITLLLVLLTLDKDIDIPQTSADLITEPSVNNVAEAFAHIGSNSEHWKKYIQKVATDRQFDNFEIINGSGKVLHQWSTHELEIDYSSNKVLVFKSKEHKVAIPWGNIISITRISTETITEQAIAKGE